MKKKIYIVFTIISITLLVISSVFIDNKLNKSEKITDFSQIAMLLEGETIQTPPTSGYYYMSQNCNGINLQWDTTKRMLTATGTGATVNGDVKCVLNFEPIDVNFYINGIETNFLQDGVDYTLDSDDCGDGVVTVIGNQVSIILSSKPTKCDIDFSVPTTYNFSYTGDVQTFIVPVSAKYRLEVYGAQGGSQTTYGGAGGYSSGEVNLTMGEKLYIYVGGSGSASASGIVNGGYNGGGAGLDGGGSGGGATDIRINSTSIYKRLIVAGGGGGAAANASSALKQGGLGGSGGGFVGETGTYPAILSGGGNPNGAGGEQTGIIDRFNSGESVAVNGSGAGGGGWYGGIAGTCTDSCGGGGGSGYVFTSTSAANYPTNDGETALSSTYYMINDVSTAGGGISENGSAVITITYS